MVKWSKTSPFHGGNPSSNLGRVTKKRSHSRENVFFYPPPRLRIFNAPVLRTANSGHPTDVPLSE